MDAQRFDLAILGSGSTAFAAALRARELGKTSVMIEERTLGGTCVNRGCLPSKNLIEAAKLVFDARNPRFAGIPSLAPSIDFASLVHQKDELIGEYRQGHYDSLVGDAIRVETGHARFLDAHTIDVDGRAIYGESLLIATGSRPVVPSIAGLDRVPYLTSDLLTRGESLELSNLPRSLLIVGGGYIALELGQMFARFGVVVTIVERSTKLLARGYEPEVGQAVAEILRAEGIDVIMSAQVQHVASDQQSVTARIMVAGAERELRAERLLVATGRRPNTDRIALERTGVRLGDRENVLVDEYLRTNVPHIFAAGDVIAGVHGAQMATPVGSKDGGIAAHNALSGEPPRAVDHRVIPRAVFIDPPLAVVGLTEREAIADGYRCWCGTVPMTLVPRAGAIRDTRGFVKMVADADNEEVLGVTMLGTAASEVIHEAAMAMRFRARVRDFVDLLHVYPTMAEALKIVAISRYKDPAKLSCCAE
jgi:mercuric reductase